ncbi:MAG TPA: hypothetical protein VLU46_08990, partial [Thermoanaerobaculia bacterium]|nr:hypothetical protein [Thermoanaerobaculia bacterium]
DSYPRGASIDVHCGKSPVASGVTPVHVVVERRANDCRLTLAKEGSEPQEVVFERQISRATSVNKVVGVPVGLVAAIGLGFLLPDYVSNADFDMVVGGFQAGMALGAAPGNQIDKHTGGAYKQVPGELFVVLIRAQQTSGEPDGPH